MYNKKDNVNKNRGENMKEIIVKREINKIEKTLEGASNSKIRNLIRIVTTSTVQR